MDPVALQAGEGGRGRMGMIECVFAMPSGSLFESSCLFSPAGFDRGSFSRFFESGSGNPMEKGMRARFQKRRERVVLEAGWGYPKQHVQMQPRPVRAKVPLDSGPVVPKGCESLKW